MPSGKGSPISTAGGHRPINRRWARSIGPYIFCLFVTAAVTESLDVDVDLRDRNAEHFFDGKLDAALDVMGDFGHAQSIFQRDKHFDDNLVIDQAYLYPSVATFGWEQHCLPIMEAWSSDSHNTAALFPAASARSRCSHVRVSALYSLRPWRLAIRRAIVVLPVPGGPPIHRTCSTPPC